MILIWHRLYTTVLTILTIIIRSPIGTYLLILALLGYLAYRNWLIIKKKTKQRKTSQKIIRYSLIATEVILVLLILQHVLFISTKLI